MGFEEFSDLRIGMIFCYDILKIEQDKILKEITLTRMLNKYDRTFMVH